MKVIVMGESSEVHSTQSIERKPSHFQSSSNTEQKHNLQLVMDENIHRLGGTIQGYLPLFRSRGRP